MTISINVTDRKTSSSINLAELKKKAAEIFNNEVRPQIEKAKTVQKPKNSLKSNYFFPELK